MTEPLRVDRRGFRSVGGFRPTGTGRVPRCPYCGNSMGHGLPGNPKLRKLQSCQVEALRKAQEEAEAKQRETEGQQEPRGREDGTAQGQRDDDAAREGASA